MNTFTKHVPGFINDGESDVLPIEFWYDLQPVFDVIRPWAVKPEFEAFLISADGLVSAKMKNESYVVGDVGPHIQLNRRNVIMSQLNRLARAARDNQVSVPPS